MATILLGFPPDSVPQSNLARIQQLVPDARVVVGDQRAAMEAALPDVEIAAGSIPHDLILRAPRLRWFQQWGAGADWLLRHPEAAEQPFVLTNASGVHAIPISEHILALMLAFARDLPASFRRQDRREWPAGDERQVCELAGQTALVIGVGAIGRRTARLAHALEMHVLGVRHNPSASVPDIERMVGPDRLQDVLPEADFVILTVPLTEETRDMIGARQLRAMKPSAYIINIGRGGTIDEEALLQALREGWIAGAGLDVFAEEPLPVSSAFWSMPNVIVTAHYSGATPYYDQRAMEIFLDNLRRFTANEPLQNVVDKKRGY